MIKARCDKNLLELIGKARSKLLDEFNLNIKNPDFIRSAILNYCSDILRGAIEIKVQRK